MIELTPATTDYLQTRRAMGYKLAEDERLLRQFTEYLDSIGAEHLTTKHALSWATQPHDAAPAWHAVRLTTIRGFARYLTALDPATEIPPRGLLPEPSHRVVPYIYSDEDIVRHQPDCRRSRETDPRAPGRHLPDADQADLRFGDAGGRDSPTRQR